CPTTVSAKDHNQPVLPMRLSHLVLLGAVAISLLTEASLAAEAPRLGSDISSMTVVSRGADQGVNIDKRMLRYHSNNKRDAEEDEEERGIPSGVDLSHLAGLAKTNKADSLGTKLTEFFNGMVKGRVNPSNIHKTELSGADYDILRQRFATWYRHYKDIE
ncbi:hypothetical protein F443_02396, partial [Phytophthora nicotianae P1569]